jgi:hypothetical protein
MPASPDLAAPHPLDRRIVLGLALTALWVLLALAWVTFALGWRALFVLPPGEIGNLLEGVVSPLAFLWLVLGLFLQQSELAQNSRALALQSEACRRARSRPRSRRARSTPTSSTRDRTPSSTCTRW